MTVQIKKEGSLSHFETACISSCLEILNQILLWKPYLKQEQEMKAGRFKKGYSSAGNLVIDKVLFRYQWDTLALGQSIYKEPEVLPTNTCLSTKIYVFQTGITMHLVRHSKLFKISYVNLL